MVSIRVERLFDNPIIMESTHPSIGENIQGPSLIRVPDWIENPLGRYYLYFADHKGTYIRLAYADDLLGSWKVHPSGSLHLEQSFFAVNPPEATTEEAEVAKEQFWSRRFNLNGIGHSVNKEMIWTHIASPDVHVDSENKRIIMYYHGLESYGTQLSRVATSHDGINFKARPEIIGPNYWRAFAHDGYTYALVMPGQFYRSKDPLSGFEEGPLLFNPNMRHSALLKRNNTLYVFWTQVGDAPERILLSTIDLSDDWEKWQETEAVEVLRPEKDWEGANEPIEPSVRSSAYGKVNQLRDPAIYVENGDIYLLYAVAGEAGLAIARVYLD
jgi:hypothetical protein